MDHTLIGCQNTLKNVNTFLPFHLKDDYSSSTIKRSLIDSTQQFDKHLSIKEMVFIAQTLNTEVMDGTPKQQKKNLKQLKRLFIQFTTMSISIGATSILGMIMVSPHLVEASALMTTPVSIGATPVLSPSTIMNWGLQLALLVVAIGAALAMSMIAVVGIYLMITRNREKAMNWNSDIVKGLVQVLVSIPLVYALFQIAQFVFRNLPILDGLM